MNLKDAGIYDLTNIFKGKATDAHGASQGSVINNKPRFINIPAYQRPYRWKAENIERLFQDYAENNEEYFLGSAVAVEKSKKDGSIEFDVVDGQQRLTTLYLLNYIRYLLRREYTLFKLKNPYQPKASELCEKLKECYVNLIGRNIEPFEYIIHKIEELSEHEEMDPNSRVDKLVSCYEEQLCIAKMKSTYEETINERLYQAHKFLDDEKLCLKYSRSRYDDILKKALCNVVLNNVPNTTDYELQVMREYKDEEFIHNYITALKTIFNEIWGRAKLNVDKDADIMEKCGKAIELADEIVENMSLCIVLTENENDANKLFEVLNDRALEVEDLELIKNHFYKEYCTKSNDTDEKKDNVITELDELWADKIFCGNVDYQNKLISYLAAVYLTCDKELSYKDGAKLKDAIEKKYSSVNYSLEERTYTDKEILSDFNAYYAVKIILENFGVKAKKLNEISLRAEQEDKSITYKTLHLLNALKYHAVIPALTNVIIASYAKNHSLIDEDFGMKFKNYICDLIEDKNHSIDEYKNIHQCAYMLWIASLKAKDYNIPRQIAKRIIEKNGRVGFCYDYMDFKGDEINNLDEELEIWLNNWTFNNKKTFAIKVLMLNLLLSQRLETEDGYKADTFTININSALTYKMDAGRLQLDHLEANIINRVNSQSYYLSDDIEKRQKDVNGYIGNFMILDAVDNNQKNDVPLKNAMEYYKRIEKSWLVDDIECMIKDEEYFDLERQIPKEEFFRERTKRLKCCFKAFLRKKLNDTQVTIRF